MGITSGRGRITERKVTLKEPRRIFKRDRDGRKIMFTPRGTARALRRDPATAAYWALTRGETGWVASRHGMREYCPKGARVVYVSTELQALAYAGR